MLTKNFPNHRNAQNLYIKYITLKKDILVTQFKINGKLDLSEDEKEVYMKTLDKLVEDFKKVLDEMFEVGFTPEDLILISLNIDVYE